MALTSVRTSGVSSPVCYNTLPIGGVLQIGFSPCFLVRAGGFYFESKLPGGNLELRTTCFDLTTMLLPLRIRYFNCRHAGLQNLASLRTVSKASSHISQRLVCFGSRFTGLSARLMGGLCVTLPLMIVLRIIAVNAERENLSQVERRGIDGCKRYTTRCYHSGCR